MDRRGAPTKQDGGRRSVRLPKMPRKVADLMLASVEAVLAAKAGNYAAPLETARWAAGLPDVLHGLRRGAGGCLYQK